MVVTPLRFYPGRLFAAWVYPDHIHTIHYDGSETRGYPPQSEAFLESARAIGYRDDVYQHMMEHDLLHSMLAERFDAAPSAALWNQAHDQRAYLKRMPPSVQRDEDRVGAAQAALNGLRWGSERFAKIGGDFGLLTELRRLLRPDGQAMTSEWARTAEMRIVLPAQWERPRAA